MIRDYGPDRLNRRPRIARTKRLRYCAVLVDFENLVESLTDSAETPAPAEEGGTEVQALDDAIEILSNLRERLRARYNGAIALGRSYADFDRIGSDAMPQLQIMALDPRFMLGGEGKGSSDVQLSIDAIDLFHSRPELDLFVIVSGDRDYLPVIRRLRENMKRVLLVAFDKAATSEVRQVLGEENVISAERLLPEGGFAEEREAERREPDYTRVEPGDNGTETAPGAVRSEVVTGEPVGDNELQLCMEELLNAYYQYGGRKVWLTPFLRMLNERFPYLDNRGRKRMVEGLQARGAIRIEKIEGDPYPYSVVEINWEDDWVQSMDEGRGNT